MIKTTFLRGEAAWLIRTEAHSRIRGAGLIILFASLTALGARISIPLPGTPVPLTFQVLVVLLTGLLLEGKHATLSQLLYLIIGTVGIPVFSSTIGYRAILGPTGGYLAVFPVAAFLVGVLSRRLNCLLGRLLATLVGVGVIYTGGASWLALWMGNANALEYTVSLSRVWHLGVAPFIVVDLAKAVLAALIVDRHSWLTIQHMLRRVKGDRRTYTGSFGSRH